MYAAVSERAFVSILQHSKLIPTCSSFFAAYRHSVSYGCSCCSRASRICRRAAYSEHIYKNWSSDDIHRDHTNKMRREHAHSATPVSHIECNRSSSSYGVRTKWCWLQRATAVLTFDIYSTAQTHTSFVVSQGIIAHDAVSFLLFACWIERQDHSPFVWCLSFFLSLLYARLSATAIATTLHIKKHSIYIRDSHSYPAAGCIVHSCPTWVC